MANIINKLLQRVSKLKNVMVEHKAGFYNPKQKPVTYPENVRIVDYRSDTLSKPSEEMKRMMMEAKLGDDVFGEDPTVRELEKKAATFLGKESALFVPSGTMSNLIALMCHSQNRGCEVLVGDESHIFIWEQAGAAQIGGIQLRTVSNKPDGTFDLKEMISKVRDSKNLFLPKTALICLENTHNTYGGRVLPINWLKEVSAVTKDLKIPLHLDGARLFNAIIKYDMPPHIITEGCDTINICLSKGLGAPIGSLLIGSEEIIIKARIIRKVIGGGMRQVGIIAAAGIYALDNMVQRLKEDHTHTFNIGKAIYEMNSKVVYVELGSIETNILLIKLDSTKVTPNLFCKRLALITEDELKEDATCVKIFPWNENTARLVVCCNNTIEDEQATIRKLQRVIHEYENGIYLVNE